MFESSKSDFVDTLFAYMKKKCAKWLENNQNYKILFLRDHLEL